MSTEATPRLETRGTTDEPTPTTWSAPTVERDRHGRPTGAHVVECLSCGVEALAGHTDTVTHRAGCDV